MTQYTTKYQKELNRRLRERAQIEADRYEPSNFHDEVYQRILNDPTIKAEIEDEMEREI